MQQVYHVHHPMHGVIFFSYEPSVTLSSVFEVSVHKFSLCSSGASGVGSIPTNSDAQNVPSFRRRRLEMMLSPFPYFFFADNLKQHKQAT